jgi:hypothetical protein
LRRIIFTLAAISLLVSTAGGMAQSKPSLAERRAITTYEKEQYPALQKKIQQAAGFDVPIEVDWNSLALPGDAEYYTQDDYFVKTIFGPIEAALAQITKDDMGKSALKESLKKISIQYGDDGISATAYGDRVKFDGGALSVNFRPFTNTADVEDRTNAILKVLEASL